jgi:CheY-like chemotaxis protein
MGPADERTRSRGLEIIERNTRLQVQLMEDMLDVSRIVTGKLHVETTPMDVRAVTEAAIEVVAPTAEAKGILLLSTLEQGTATVWGDPARLQQVVLNLLSNAVKFTPRGGRVEIRLAYEGGEARITVTDTGRGIPAELLPHVFDRFCQGDTTTTRTHGGLGLGLAIARHLTERHGGTIHAEGGGEGRGARFTVTLPLAKGPARTAATAARSAGLGRLEGVHVLLVEDRNDAREVFLETFERTGARVTAVGSVAAAMEALAREWPDVLVSDIAMPGEDGYTLIQKVRGLEGDRAGRLPAMALTAYAGVEARARALASGYDLHVAKPVQPTELIAAVAGLVRDRL